MKKYSKNQGEYKLFIRSEISCHGNENCDRKRRSVGLGGTNRDNVHIGDSQEGGRPTYLPVAPF